MSTEPASEPRTYCLDCSYAIDGLPDTRCPECGRTFDPADPATYAGRVRGGGLCLLIAALGGVAFAGGMSLAYLHESGTLSLPGVPLLTISIPAGVVTCVIVAAVAYDGLFGRHTAIRQRSRLYVAIAIAAAITLWGMVHTIVKLLPLFVG